jgi:hypothetical protein
MNRAIPITIPMAVGCLAVAACGASTPPAAAHMTAPAVAATSSAPAGATNSAVPTPTVNARAARRAAREAAQEVRAAQCQSQMVTWANATGGRDLSTVNTDISDLQSAIATVEQTTQNPMDPSIVQAATTLSQDAEQAAGADHPPKCNRFWLKTFKAYGALAFGALDVQYGSDARGVRLLKEGQRLLKSVTAEISALESE